MYASEVIDEVVSRSDIVDIISGYIKLKKNGSSYVGLCPFHNEKSPSFSVSPGKQLYHCFGCGVGGNVITFVMEYENYTFLEAVKYLADKAGMQLPETSYSEEEKKNRDLKAKLLEINKIAATYYYHQLKAENGKIGLSYLQKRGLSDTTINRFGLGYAGQTGNALYQYLKSKGYDDALLKETGLFTYERGIHDKFWNRVMFPIMDINNKVIGFGGRVMGDAKPKYLNSPETKLFDKSRNLYGLNAARISRKSNMIICEGYMDVISLHQAGFTQAVASLGTALTPGQAALMKRYTDNVLITYDSDAAGVKAALRAIPILKEAGLTTKVINMQPYKDPDEFIKAKGAAEFSKLLVNAVHYISFEIACIQRKYNLKNPEHRVRFATEAAEILAKLDSEIERNVYLGEVSRVTGVEEEAIRSEIRKLVQKEDAAYQRETEKRQQNLKNYTPEGRRKDKGLLEAQRSLLYYAAQHQGIYDTLKEILEEDDFTEGIYWRTFGDIGDLWQNAGHVFPADLVSRFEDAKEQKQVTEIFAVQLPTENGADMEKAINEQVKRLKRTKIDHLTANAATVEEIQRLVEAKRKLDSLYITI